MLCWRYRASQLVHRVNESACSSGCKCTRKVSPYGRAKSSYQAAFRGRNTASLDLKKCPVKGSKIYDRSIIGYHLSGNDIPLPWNRM